MLVALFSTAVLMAAPFSAQCPTYLPPAPVGALQSNIIDEASGLVASRANPGVLWTHNDDGNEVRVFAIRANGILLGTWNLSIPSGADHEDIAIGPGPTPGVSYIYFADTGDNNNVRSQVKVHRFVEPTVSVSQSPPVVATIPVDTITMHYPTGVDAPSQKDCETLLVDTNGDIYLVTKRTTVGRIYRAAYPQAVGCNFELTFVGQMTWGGFTAGEIAPSGNAIILRNYTRVGFWFRPPGMTVAQALSGADCAAPLTPDLQGEAICFKPGTFSYYTTSEGIHAPIYLTEQTTACVPADCDDGNPCTTDTCESGNCVHVLYTTDADGDGVADCADGCPNDVNKTSPGACGCGVSDADLNHDGQADCQGPCAQPVGALSIPAYSVGSVALLGAGMLMAGIILLGRMRRYQCL